MSGQIITIGRQFGSGGREIGETIARKLDIPCYDRELPSEKIAPISTVIATKSDIMAITAPFPIFPMVLSLFPTNTARSFANLTLIMV